MCIRDRPNIDTGMGLERLAVVMQDVDNLFEVDTVAAVLHHVERISGKQYEMCIRDRYCLRKGETTPMSIRRLAVLCTAMLCAGMLVLCRVFWIAADQSLSLIHIWADGQMKYVTLYLRGDSPLAEVHAIALKG